MIDFHGSLPSDKDNDSVSEVIEGTFDRVSDNEPNQEQRVTRARSQTNN